MVSNITILLLLLISNNIFVPGQINVSVFYDKKSNNYI